MVRLASVFPGVTSWAGMLEVGEDPLFSQGRINNDIKLRMMHNEKMHARGWSTDRWTRQHTLKRRIGQRGVDLRSAQLGWVKCDDPAWGFETRAARRREATELAEMIFTGVGLWVDRGAQLEFVLPLVLA